MHEGRDDMQKALGLGALAALLPFAAAAEPVARAAVEAAIPEMVAMAEGLVADGAVPGLAIAVVHDDEVVYLGGFGLREAGRPETVDADTVFQIASMSKPISSTVVAKLVTEGLVDWDSRIVELNPRFALHDPYPTAEVRLRDLFAHRSGLPGTSGDDLEAIGYDREAIMERLRLVPPSSSFRAGYAYSNAGLTQGALAAAMAAGQDWETVAEERLFRPLGMVSTSYRHDDFLARENRAELHVRPSGAWEALVKRDPDEQAPAGGVSSTVRDLAEWMRLELGRGSYAGEAFIDADAIAATHAPVISRGPNPISGGASFYGLGWNLEFGRHGLSWGHAGAFSTGARSGVTLYPDAGLGIVVLCNAFPTGVPEGIADSFFDLVFDGSVSRDWVSAWDAAFASLFGPAMAAARATWAAPPEPATPALPDAAYLGTYANAYAGEAVVAAEAGGLVLKLGPGGETVFPLIHFDRDTFLYDADAEMPGFHSAARFAVGPDGKATALTAESLDSNGLGTFTRTN
jgi:CubicO group peptidase (beta-lactamase class C family)